MITKPYDYDRISIHSNSSDSEEPERCSLIGFFIKIINIIFPCIPINYSKKGYSRCPT